MTIIREYQIGDFNSVARLIAELRVSLSSLKGLSKKPNVASAKEELQEFLDAEYPIFIAELDGEIVGYAVCRVDSDVVWTEQMFVHPDSRRMGIASSLYGKIEELVKELGGETVYNWVHPNNDTIIEFLKQRGYNVLNLIEIRGPWKGETPQKQITVDKHEFEY